MHGLIVQARMANQRTYHLLVPLTVVSETSRPRLVLSTDPAQSTNMPFDRLLLRTLPRRQNYYVFVRNPSANAFDVIIEVMSGTKPIATSGPNVHADQGPIRSRGSAAPVLP